MPTTVTSTIGAAGDYTSWAAWEAASPANLVTDDKIWEGAQLNEEIVSASNILTIAGITTDATRFLRMTTASGASFVDHADKATNALRYNASNGAAIRFTGGYTWGVVISVAYTKISKLQIKCTNGGGGVVGALNVTGIEIDQCILDSATGNSGYACAFLGPAGFVRNTLAVCNYSGASSTTFGIGGGLSGTLTLYNCTIVRASDSAGGGNGAPTGYSTNLLKNCAIFGFGTFAGTLSASSDYNASDLAIGTGTHNQASKTYANQFENTTIAAGDYRIKAGADLIDTGVDLSGSGVTVGIIGNSRSAPYDIGAWETALATIIGTVEATLDAVTGVATGVLAIVGQVAATLADVTGIATGVLSPIPTTATGGDAHREDVARLSRRQRRLERQDQARAIRLREALERAHMAATGGDEPAMAAALTEAAQEAPPAQRARIAAIPDMGELHAALAEIDALLRAIQQRRHVVFRDDDDLMALLAVL